MFAKYLINEDLSDFKYGGDMYEDIINNMRNIDNSVMGIISTSPPMNIILRDEIMKIYRSVELLNDDNIRILSRSLRLADFINYKLKLKDRSRTGELARNIWNFYYEKDVTLVEDDVIMQFMSGINIFPPSIIDFINIYRSILALSMDEHTSIKILSVYAIKSFDIHRYPMHLCALATIGLISRDERNNIIINKILRKYCRETIDKYEGCMNFICYNYQSSNKSFGVIDLGYSECIPPNKNNLIASIEERESPVICDYRLQIIPKDILGKGGYATVNKQVINNQVYAIKTFKNRKEAIFEFINLNKLNYPFIVSPKGYGPFCITYPLYYMDLYFYREQMGNINDALTKSYMYQLLLATNYCHKNGVAHLDIKPSNILITEEGSIGLTDFGNARRFGIPVTTYDYIYSTYIYSPPEVLREHIININEEKSFLAVDIWAIGCTFAYLLSKKNIFVGKVPLDIYKSIINIIRSVSEKSWQIIIPHITNEQADLLDRLLRFLPNERISTLEALNHSYFDSIRSYF